MKRKLPLLCVLAAALAIAGYRRTSLLRLEDATGLRVTSARTPSQMVITGGMMHSGMTVTRATAEVCGTRVIARVYIEGVKDMPGVGNYRFVAIVPKTANEIWFGDPPHWMTIGTMFGFPLRLPRLGSSNDDGGVIWRRAAARETLNKVLDPSS